MRKWILTISIAALLISFASLLLQVKTAEKDGVFEETRATEVTELTKENTE